MEFTKITNEEMKEARMEGLPDTPGLSITEMQKKFDAYPALAVHGINRMVQELTEEGAASAIGAHVPDGVNAADATRQSIINALALSEALNVDYRHQHGNMQTLQEITDGVKGRYDRLVTMLSGINEVTNHMSGTASELPTGSAVKEFVEQYDFKTVIRNLIYPIGAIVFFKSTMTPNAVIGGKWGRLPIVFSEDAGVVAYVRTE